MKKSTRINLAKFGLRVLFYGILIGMYSLGVLFINDCQIASDSRYLALCGLAFIMTMLVGLLLWCLIFDSIDKHLSKMNKYISKNRVSEKQAHLNRMIEYQEKRNHKMFDILEAQRKEDLI